MIRGCTSSIAQFQLEGHGGIAIGRRPKFRRPARRGSSAASTCSSPVDCAGLGPQCPRRPAPPRTPAGGRRPGPGPPGARSVSCRFSAEYFSNSTVTCWAALAGSNSWTVIRCTAAPAGIGSTDHCRTLAIEDVDHLVVGRHLDGQLAQFGPADRVGQVGAAPRDAFLDPDLLLGLDAGQGGQAGGPFGLGRPVDADRGRRADEGQDDGLVRPWRGFLGFLRARPASLPGFVACRFRLRRAASSVAAMSGWMLTFTPACGIRTRQRLTGACGAWNDDAVLTRHPADRLGVFQATARSAPAACPSSPPAGGGPRRRPADDAGRARRPAWPAVMAASASRSGTSCQPSANRSIFDRGLHRTTSLATVASFSMSVITRADRRPRLGGGPGLVLGRPPQFLELLVGQEHAAAVLLEHLPQLLVGNVDVLFVQGAPLLRLCSRTGRLIGL